MKLGNLTLAYEALQALMQAELPIKTAYALSKALDPITKELNHLEFMRSSLMLRAEQGSYAKSYVIAEYNKLLEEDIDLDLPAVPVREVLDSNAKISPLGIHILITIGVLTED